MALSGTGMSKRLWSLKKD